MKNRAALIAEAAAISAEIMRCHALMARLDRSLARLAKAGLKSHA